jgi:hypothetical protein
MQLGALCFAFTYNECLARGLMGESFRHQPIFTRIRWLPPQHQAPHLRAASKAIVDPINPEPPNTSKSAMFDNGHSPQLYVRAGPQLYVRADHSPQLVCARRFNRSQCRQQGMQLQIPIEVSTALRLLRSLFMSNEHAMPCSYRKAWLTLRVVLTHQQ